MKSLLLLLDSMIFYDRQIIKGIKSKIDEINLNVEINLECSSNLDYIFSKDWDYVIADYDKPNINHIIDSLSAKAVVYSNHEVKFLPSNVSSVILDNKGLATTALKGFCIAGIKRVGYFANQQDSVLPWSKERGMEFKSAALVQDCEVVDCVETALKERNFPLGIYCSSDRAARRVANLCYRQGIKVPQDVSIIGTDYDDTERMLSPIPMSSVELNPVELGMLCAETLDKTLKYKRPQRSRFTSYKLLHARTTNPQQALDEVIIRAENYIRNHFHLNMKIKQVTDHCRVSRKTLDTRFLVAHGITAHQYVTQLRLERAKKLLATTVEKLDVIAKQCGYPGQSYLSQVFIKQIGVTPMRFRQQHTLQSNPRHNE